MALTINTNLASLNAQRNLSRNSMDLQTAIQRLSSGLRVNSAKDDAAGLYNISLQTAAITGVNQASRNAADGISFAQTAEGGMAEVQKNLQRIRELAVQSANGATSNDARSGIQAEVDQLTQEISRIVATSSFNGTQLLDGSTTSLSFQVGQNGTANNQVSVTLSSLTGISGYSSSVTATNTVDVSSAATASAAITNMDSAIKTVATAQTNMGAVQNRFDAVISNLSVYAENLTAARSRIQDADFAAETAKLTRAQVLQQAGVAMVTQANALPQSALALLR